MKKGNLREDQNQLELTQDTEQTSFFEKQEEIHRF